jgi:hypothetical protein
MPAQIGVDSTIGVKNEVSWGTEITVDRFYEMRTESIKLQRQLIPSEGLRSGRRNLNRSDTYRFYNKGAAGDVEMEWMNKGMGWWLKHMLGLVTSNANTPVAGAHQHVGSILSTSGSAFTLQVAKDTMPFTYIGCKLTGWSLECAVDELLVFTPSIRAKAEVAARFVTDGVTTNASTTVTSATALFTAYDVGKKIAGTGIPAAATIVSVTSATAVVISAAATASGTALTLTIGTPEATASYPAGLVPMSFIEGSVTLGGVALDVKAFDLSCDMNLPERWFFGAISKEPIDQGRTIEGSFDTEYEDNGLYQRFVTGTEGTLTLVFSTASQGLFVTGTTPYTLTITGTVRLEGDTPNVSGPEIIEQTTPFTVLNDTFTITAVNGDAVA